MGLSVRKNLGGLTGKEDNIQEEPTIFRTKPLLQMRTKITEKKEMGKRKHNVGESEPVSKRRKTEEKKEVEARTKVEEAPKMVRLTMASLRPNMNMFKMYNVKATPEAPAVKKEQNFSKIKKEEKVPVFGVSSQIETIILF